MPFATNKHRRRADSGNGRLAAWYTCALALTLLSSACSTEPNEAEAQDSRQFETGQTIAAVPEHDTGVADADQKAICTPEEATRIATVMEHAAEMGPRIAATGTLEGLDALARETRDLNATLSASCQAFATRLGQDLEMQKDAGRAGEGRYSPFGGQRIFHDSATRTFTAPGIASCTPTGCFVN